MKQREKPKVKVNLISERRAALREALQAARDLANNLEKVPPSELRDVIGSMSTQDLRTAVYLLTLQVRDLELRTRALERRG